MDRKEHELSMLGEHFLQNIMSGRKKYEGRINSKQCQAMKVGDLLKLYEHDAGWGIVCSITSLNPFPSFEEMLTGLGILNLLPQLEPLSKTAGYDALLQEGVRIYRAFPGSERVLTLGCVGIGVKFLQQYR